MKKFLMLVFVFLFGGMLLVGCATTSAYSQANLNPDVHGAQGVTHGGIVSQQHPTPTPDPQHSPAAVYQGFGTAH